MTHGDHISAAFRFLELAGALSIEQDALAKSEMLWCAAAHVVKAVVIQQQWRNLSHRSHEQLFDAAVEINDVLGIPGAYSDFNIADRLHRNMYEGFMRADEIADAEPRVREFVNRVSNAITG